MGTAVKPRKNRMVKAFAVELLNLKHKFRFKSVAGKAGGECRGVERYER